jgi:hypothetical protein
MSKRKVFSLICLILTVLLLINLFLPFAKLYGEDYSYWTYFSKGYDIVGFPILILIGLIIAMVVFVLQLCGVMQDYKLAGYGLGFYSAFFMYALMGCLKHGSWEGFSVGFYLGWIVSIILLIVFVIGSFLSNKTKPKTYYGYGQPQPAGYDPYTGKPIYK